MGSKIEYVDSTHLYATNYVRNSKAIGVLWAIFTICYAIISVVAFVTPEWIGDLETEYPRKFGLWQMCRADDALEDCKGRLDDFLSINGLVFKIATVLVGLAVALALFTICAMLLFFFCQSTTVFHICGWLQLFSVQLPTEMGTLMKQDMKEVKCPPVCEETGAFKKIDMNLKDIQDLNAARAQTEPYHGALAGQAQEDIVREPKEDILPGLEPGPSGKPDWTVLADMTGTRPAVNKYSIARYSLDEWRRQNQRVLDQKAVVESNIVEYNAKTAIMQAFGTVDKIQNDNTKRLRQKAKDVYRWKVEVERAVKAITDEVRTLEAERQRLKGASRTLMLPEAISQECLEIRTNKQNIELVSDLAEQELRKEYALVEEVRSSFKKALKQVDDQLADNRAAKQRIEYDFCDKELAYTMETLNLKLDKKSNTIMWRPGATKFGENSAPLEYWEYFCRESIQNCEACRQKSMELRSGLGSVLEGGGRKLRIQADLTDKALAETIAITQEVCTKLEDTLRVTLQRIADMESLIQDLQSATMKMDAAMKLAQTRLDNRNNCRPHGENVRDTPHMGLIDEVKTIHQTVTALLGQRRNAERVREDLIVKRRELEAEIASKRKNLDTDRARCGFIRTHYPSALQLAGH